MDLASILIAGLIGVLVAFIVSLIPGLHIYNVIAITMVIIFSATTFFSYLDAIILTSFFVGLIVSFSMLFTVSSLYFQPSDDSIRFIMLPHERYLLEGRGHEAAAYTAVGGLIAVIILAVGVPIFGTHINVIKNLLTPHLYWIIGLVITFILMTEWPKDPGTAKTVRERFLDGWIPLLMGYLTFFLSAMLGIFIFYKTIIPIHGAFQSLMPVFIGLFAIPSQIIAIISKTDVPRQYISKTVELPAEDVAKGGLSGLMAGSFAAFVPSVTPGPALLLSGHYTVNQGDRQFMIAGGVARVIYYVGAVMIFFLPELYMRRGGAAINISLFFVPETTQQFYILAGVIALTGFITFILLFYFSRLCSFLVSKVNYKLFSIIGIIVLTGLVAVVTSWQGLLIMLVATLIGLIPNLWHTRRINLLAVLLVPIFLNMMGIGPDVAHWLGLI